MKKSKLVKTSRKVILEKTVDSNSIFVLTIKGQHSKKCRDGKKRSFWLYYLNNILILKQKVPFDETSEYGWQNFIGLRNVYLLGNNLHQERIIGYRDKIRTVKFPVSKTILQALNVPTDLKINLKDK